MKTKQTIALVSSSALAAGMAHGQISYSGPINYVLSIPSPNSGPVASTTFEMNGYNSFFVGWDGTSTSNYQKPYIAGEPNNSPGAAILAQYVANDGGGNASYGLPVTTAGTMINSSYLTPDYTNHSNYGYAYFFQDGNGKQIGGWTNTASTDAYVGIELWNGAGGTNFGWIELDYNGPAQTLTVVDWAYQTTPGVGILAGAVPEPATSGIVLAGIGALYFSRRFRRSTRG